MFIRKIPGILAKDKGFAASWNSMLSTKGFTVNYAGRNITFLFLGCGRIQKTLHPEIIRRINSGRISDIVDVGGGGALDPELRAGDCVLSTGEIPLDTQEPIKVNRRHGTQEVAKELSSKHNSRLFQGKILTSPRFILTREERIKLFHQTGCSVVQMEHCWFLRTLQNCLDPQALSQVKFTHMEIVTDEVPESASFLKALPQLYFSFKNCVLRNEKFLGQVKKDFLSLLLGARAIAGEYYPSVRGR